MALPTVFRLGLAVIVILLLLSQATAHLDLTRDELVDYYRNTKRDSDALTRCLKSPEMREYNIRMLAHQNETLHNLRKTRGIDSNLDLEKRGAADRDKYVNTNHETNPGRSRDPQELFDFRWNEAPRQHAGCVLTPGSIYGPFWKDHQPLRADIRAGQRGIYLRLAMRVIDYSTCRPLHGALVDIWHANSLGEYSGNMDGFLRGWQPTSNQGTVDFDTNFPGHYNLRASHIHVVVRTNPKKRAYSVGQIYFDQKLRDAVEATDRYKNNKNQNMGNGDDLFIPGDSSSTYDPFVHWSKIGNSLEDGGLLGWITLGVDTTNHNIEQPPRPDAQAKRDIVDWHLA